MRISSDGQVRVPKALIDRAGIRPGGEVVFGFNDGAVTLKAANEEISQTDVAERLMAAIDGIAKANIDRSTDEIMTLLRGDE